MNELSPFSVASIWTFAIGIVTFGVLLLYHRANSAGTGPRFVYFNPQDYFNSSPEIPLPAEAEKATFKPFIAQYTGLAKITIGLAAASISFGGISTKTVYIDTAKMLLAFSIAFGVLFCVLMISFYENYLHGLQSYKPYKCALTEASGLTSLACFALGYGYWALHVGT